MAVAASLCIAALGLLIGVLAKILEEQSYCFFADPDVHLLPGLGGAWTPLEYTSATFQAIGHVTPIAWAMDGFKNVSIRGLGVEGVLMPALALLGYAILFFAIAAWRFQVSQEH